MEPDNDTVEVVDVISISDGGEDDAVECPETSTPAMVTPSPAKGNPKNDGEDDESSDACESEEDDKWIRLTIGQVHPSSIFALQVFIMMWDLLGVLVLQLAKTVGIGLECLLQFLGGP